MTAKKRTNRSRLRGRRSCGCGHKSKPRGKGSHGGKGMAGTGKKAGQKLTWIWRYMPDYMGKRGFKSRSNVLHKKPRLINLLDIHRFSSRIIEKDKKKLFDLKGFKILSKGKVSEKLSNEKLTIIADSFSKKAEDKISKMGWTIQKTFDIKDNKIKDIKENAKKE